MNKPRHNFEAERSLISSIIISPEILPDVMGTIKPEHFYDTNLRIIYKAILFLMKNNIAIDLVTVSNKLKSMEVEKGDGQVDPFKKENYLDYIGGLTYLVEITENVGFIKNYQEYIKIIFENYRIRQISKTLNYGLNNIDNNLSSDEILKSLEKNIRKVVVGGHIGDIEKLDNILLEQLDNLANSIFQIDTKKTIYTYLNDLDRLAGPMKGGNLIIIGGRPGTGKTAFAMNIINNNLQRNKRIAFFSMEMNKEEIVNRFISMHTDISMFELKSWSNRGEGISQEDFENKREKQYQEIVSSIDNLFEKELFIDTSPNLTPSKVRSRVSLINMEKPVDLIVIDYLQLMKGETKGLNKTNELGEISRELKIMANEFDCPVVALTQLNRKSDERANKRPVLSEIRSSGDIEQDANMVMLLYRDKYYDEFSMDDTLEVILAKNRDGGKGTINIEYDLRKNLMWDCSEEKIKTLNGN